MKRGSAEPEDAERRMAEAMTILETGGDANAQRRARTRRLVIVTVVVVLTVISATIGVLLARHTHGHPGQRHHREQVALWHKVTGLTMSTAGLTVNLVGLVRWRRSGRWATAWRTPLLALTGRQRRDLLRQVRGQVPLDPDRLPFLTDLARRLRDNYQGPFGPQMLIMAGAGLVLAGNAVRIPWLLFFLVPYMALYPAAVTTARRDSRRASTFLSQHPEPSRSR